MRLSLRRIPFLLLGGLLLGPAVEAAEWLLLDDRTALDAALR